MGPQLDNLLLIRTAATAVASSAMTTRIVMMSCPVVFTGTVVRRNWHCRLLLSGVTVSRQWRRTTVAP